MSTATTTTAPTSARERIAPSPQATAGTGRIRCLVAQVSSEILRMVRIPQYAVGVVAMPLILFCMFGLPATSQKPMPSGMSVAAMLWVSFGCYGMVSQALFSMGGDLGTERKERWLRRMRSTPMPMWVYFGGKLVQNVLIGATILLGMLALLVFAGGVRPPAQIVPTAFVILSGTVLLAPMGMAIAYWVRPKAVMTVVQLVFLPLSFASGFFQPLSQLPGVLQDVALYLPTYHYGQMAWATFASAEDRELFSAPSSMSPMMSVAIVAAWFVVMLVLAAWGYRRDLARERD